MRVSTTLGALIRQRRLELGWTQEEFAERISSDDDYVRQSEVSRIEGGRIQLPRRERLERIAEALNLPLGELLALSGWAGAESYFATGDLHQDAVAPSDTFTEPSATDADTVTTVRHAIDTWRERSDRSDQDRLTMDDIERQFMRLVSDPQQPSSDGSSGTDDE